MEKNANTVLLSLAVLCLAVLGSLGWGIYEHRQVKRVKQEQVQAEADRARSEKTEVALLHQQIEQQRDSAEKARQESAATIRKLGTQLAEMKAQPTAAKSDAAADALSTTASKSIAEMKAKIGKLNALAGKGMPGAEGGKDGTAPGKPFMANIAKMMKNPEMRKMVQAQQKPMLEMTWGPLYDLLDVPEEQKAQLRGLLEKRQNDLLDISFEMMDDALPAEQKAEKQKAMTAMNKQMEKEIETLLGKENFTVYKTYQETQPERSTVQMFSQGLDPALQMNELQKNDLVFEMHKVRSGFKFSTDLEKKDTVPDFNKITPEMMQTHLEEARQLNAKYMEAAGKLMNATQLEKFRASLDQQQQMQEFGMKMLVGEPKK